ncbi:DNA-packaging protein [Fretibacter rubidus]|uniref:DNA-packaging protein n=1 Tax=Fretibacter rubidus TaxID=570162 RepID=UPI00352A39EF
MNSRDIPQVYEWQALARNDQWPPAGDWLIWLLLGGRGCGKTRAGAEWVRAQIKQGAKRVALVAPTYNDAREVMLFGESGLMNLGPVDARPRYQSSRRRLEWPNGAVGFVYSSEDPDGLRGPQFDCAWGDEFCAWAYPDDTLSNLRLALRLGDKPRLVMTTTPRPIAALTALMAQDGLVVSTAKTSDNAANLSPVFIKAVEDAYGGTRLGRQELGGEIITDHAGALWTRAMIEACHMEQSDAREFIYDKIIIALDPPVTSGVRSDACGLVVAGLLRGQAGEFDTVHILQDATVQGLSPEAWARRAIGLWESYGADYILAEVNQGGEMVALTLKTIDPEAIVKTVHASRGKAVRAEPVAALYEQGRVKHVRTYSELEDELCTLGTESLKHSPDRADALVWAVTDLLLSRRGRPRVRRV